MQLYIVRHGIAIDREDPTCPADPERYLTEEGVEKAKQVAKGVAALGVTGELFLTSPYVRAAQTAEIFASALEYARQKIRRTDLLLPGAEPSQLFRELAKAKQASATCRGAKGTTFSVFAAAFTINGMRRYSSKRCLPAASRAAVSISSGRPGTRNTTASADFSARKPAPLATPHLRSALARRKTPAKARTLFCCSAESLEKAPSFARGSAPRW